MTNISIVLIYCPFLLISAIVTINALQRLHTDSSYRPFCLMSTMVLGWQFFTGAGLLAVNFLAPFLFNSILPFVAFATLGLLLFSVYFCHLNRYITKGVVVALSVIPAITTVLWLTDRSHSLLHTELTFVALQPLREVIFKPGIWYYVHLIYSYILVMTALLIVYRQFARLPKAYRFCSALLMTGIGICILSNVINVVFFLEDPFDFSVVGTGVALLLMYVAMSNNERLDFLMMARNEIFNYLDEAVFILDNDLMIIERNRTADKWLDYCNIPQDIKSFETVFSILEEQGAVVKKAVEDVMGLDLYIMSLHRNEVFNLRETALKDKTGKPLGTFITCSDVTENRKLIHWLENKVGIDALTGLPNRQKFELLKAEYDQKQYLPLAVIAGDVNGLKEVNDNLGHHQGDNLLQVVAQTLENCKPERGYAIRFGGDEYLLFIPNCSREQAERVMDRIHEELSGVEGYPFRPSISLGFATKEHPDEDLEELISMADEEMYNHKKQFKYEYN